MRPEDKVFIGLLGLSILVAILLLWWAVTIIRSMEVEMQYQIVFRDFDKEYEDGDEATEFGRGDTGSEQE